MTNEPTTPEVGGEKRLYEDLGEGAIRDVDPAELASPPAVQEEGLKPCPWCAGPGAVISTDPGKPEGYFAMCKRDCDMACATDWYDDRASAVERWNCRPTPSPAIPDREEIVGVLRSIVAAHGQCVCNDETVCSVPGVGCLGDHLSAEVSRALALLAKLGAG